VNPERKVVPEAGIDHVYGASAQGGHGRFLSIPGIDPKKDSGRSYRSKAYRE
jgi:hypothetical protein